MAILLWQITLIPVTKHLFVFRSVEPSPSRNNAREATGGATGGGSTKFVSTTEMMQRFQNGTPGNS